MLKLETTWIRIVVSEEGRPLYTETEQWWSDADDSTWMHTGHTTTGRTVARSFAAGFATAYLEQQRAFHEITGWCEAVPGSEAFPTPVTQVQIEGSRTAWFKKVVQEEPAA